MTGIFPALINKIEAKISPSVSFELRAAGSEAIALFPLLNHAVGDLSFRCFTTPHVSTRHTP